MGDAAFTSLLPVELVHGADMGFLFRLTGLIRTLRRFCDIAAQISGPPIHGQIIAGT
jgi:hypothetical protein